MTGIDYTQKIPNNVDLKSDKRLQRALERWQPDYLDWWRDMGPTDFNENDVYLRTAVSVDRDGWANFGYVKMPDYRWGIFLTPTDPGAKIGFVAAGKNWLDLVHALNLGGAIFAREYLDLSIEGSSWIHVYFAYVRTLVHKGYETLNEIQSHP